MDENKRVPPRPPESEKPAETTPPYTPSKETLAMIQRAALAMADRKRVNRPAEPRAFDDAARVASGKPQAKLIAELDSLLSNVRSNPAASAEPDHPSRPEATSRSGDPGRTLTHVTPNTAAAALRPLFDDQYRLSLTRLQSASIAVAIFAFTVGACGIAAQTWTTARDWNCRTGLMKEYCPPPVAVPQPPPPLPPPEIPI